MRDSWARPIAIYASAAALFLASEFLLFRTPFYRSLLEPESYSAQVGLLLAAQRQQPPSAASTVLVLGDSRIGEGFSAKIANESVQDHRLTFANAAISGSTPRSWYYVLRELGSGVSNYRAIVLAVDDYRDEDGVWSWADYPIDLPIAVACLRLNDTLSFAASFHQAADRFYNLRGALLKGFVYKDDWQALLANPRARFQKVAAFREHSAEWRYGYTGRPESLAGLSVDWATRSVHFPSGLTEAQRRELSTAILRDTDPQHGDKFRYRKYWLGRILERYRSKSTRIIFARVPRLPVQRPEPANLPSAIRDLAASGPGSIVLDENAFASLEKPEYFADSLHLNASGRAAFSQQLAALIQKTAAP
ncbi:MAG: hypothetical protein LAP38_22025 [Acidobacteriia bacterium]|nr:hypothetical protein [Terriglobia bacterium]